MAQIKFWTSREIVYKFMFTFLAIVCFFSTQGVIKSLTCFALILVIGDLMDKVLFGITGYVIGDIFLIVVGIIVSVIVYGRSSLGGSQKPNS